MKPRKRLEYIAEIVALQKEIAGLNKRHSNDTAMVLYYRYRYEAYIELFKIVFSEKSK